MKANWCNLKLSKDIIKRKYFIKKNLQNLILKSFIRNQNIKPLLRAFASLKLNVKNKRKNNLSVQQNRCLLSGKAKTTFKFSGFSRQSSKNLIDLGLLQNIKSYSY